MISEESDEQSATEELEITPIADLTPSSGDINTKFKVIGKSEAREVYSRRNDETYRVADTTVGDSTGTVIIPLWNDAIEKFQVGSTYLLKNCYTGLFKGNLRLKIGNESEIVELDDGIDDVDMTNDLSAVDHGQDRRRRQYGSSRDRGYRRDRRGSRRRRW